MYCQFDGVQGEDLTPMKPENHRREGRGLSAIGVTALFAIAATMLAVACGGGGGGGGGGSTGSSGHRRRPTPTPVGNVEFVYVANNAANLGNSVQPYFLNTTNGILHSVGNILAGKSPQAVAITPDGKFCYVVNNGDNTITAFSIGALGTALAHVKTTATGASPNGVAIYSTNSANTPNPVAVYVANGNENSISQYSINSDGSLSPMNPAKVLTGGGPFGLAVLPIATANNGNLLYVSLEGANEVQAFAINASSGKLSAVSGFHAPTTGASPQGIAIAPNGTVLFTANSGEPDTSTQQISGFSISPVDGSLTSTGSGAAGSQTVDVAIDSTSSFLYATNEGSNTVSMFKIAAGTGTLISNGSINSGTAPVGIFTINSAPHPAVYVTNSGDGTVSMYNNDAVSGALTPIPPGTITAEQGPVAIAAIINDGNSSNAAYVVNSGNDIVSEYAVDTTTGALSPGGADPVGAGGAGTWGVAADPHGRWVYASNFTNNTLGEMVINSDGSLNPNPAGSSYPLGTGSGAEQIMVDPLANFVYVVETTGGGGTGLILQLEIDQNNGTLSGASAGGANAQPSSMAMDSGANNLYVTEVGTGTSGGDVLSFSVNSANHALNLIGTAASGKTPVGITVAPGDGFVYAANNGDNTITGFTRNTNNGSLTPIAHTTATGNGPEGLASVAAGTKSFLYVANSTDGTVGQYEINSDGSLTALKPSAVASASGNPNLMTIDPAGRYLYVTSNNANKTMSEFAINSDGTLKLLGMATTGDSPHQVSATVKH